MQVQTDSSGNAAVDICVGSGAFIYGVFSSPLLDPIASGLNLLLIVGGLLLLGYRAYDLYDIRRKRKQKEGL